MGERRYAVLGAGRQGRAAAYDLAKFGNASGVVIVDRDPCVSALVASELNLLLGSALVHPIALDATDPRLVGGVLRNVDGFVSAMHYELNLALTKMAIDAGCHMVDLGGNTSVVWEQHGLDLYAKRAGVRIIPDCGMAPGFNVTLACVALEKMKYPKSMTVYCGGIPQNPQPPLGYHFPFSMSGLVNECSGFADIIRGGTVTQRSCLFSVEEITLPSVGILEATHTSGGLSTAPWTLHKRYPTLETFEYQTLRYPGHWKILQDLARKGELKSGLEVLAQVTPPDLEDLGIIQACGKGFDERGASVTVILEVVDRYDPVTRFTAMQRLTGFHASIMLIAATETLKGNGVLGVESVDPVLVINEFARRGITTDETTAVQA